MAANHREMEAGKNYGGQGLHDHRFQSGIPGMGTTSILASIQALINS